MSQHAAGTLWSTEVQRKMKRKKNPAVLQLMVSETFVFVLCFRGCARQSPSTKYHRWKVSGSFRFAFLPYFIPSHLLSLVKLFKCSFYWGRRLTVKVPLSFLSLFFYSFYLQIQNYLPINYGPREGTSFPY